MFSEVRDQPDILEVISSLSSDEVPTPPKVANAVLDLLPTDVWTTPDLRWLDPGTKTGVFLREATRRLMVGLQEAIPDKDERLKHILKHMMHGVAITELTALMSRRTLYCSKDASGPKSEVQMSTSAGNIWMERVEHEYVSGKCRVCGASEAQMEGDNQENHAYGFVHPTGLEAIARTWSNMKFDVIVGNPPYQMDSDGNTRTMPIYQKFVEQAKELNPAYIAMVIPSRWMVGGLGLADFRRDTLNDKRFRALVDFPNASEVFPGVEIKGGVCYFLWDRDTPGPCMVTTIRGEERVTQERELNEFDVFVRDGKSLGILHKVLRAGGPYMSEVMSARTAFGVYSNFVGYHSTRQAGDVKYYATSPRGRVEAWVPRTAAAVNHEAIDLWKALIPKAASDGGQRLPDIVLGQPWVAEPPSICTQSFIFVSVATQEEAESVCSYYRTRFLRFLVSLRKITQDTTRDSYLWVPQQTWDREWTDADLYEKYDITEEEQAYIAEMVKEMPA